MRRGILVAGCLLIAGLAWMLWPSGGLAPQRYPPIKHTDGTTEFRLINAGQDRKDGTADDQHWVLRLPAGLWVDTPDEGRSAQEKKDNPDYPYNTNFSLIVGLPDVEFVQDPFERPSDDNLRVSVTSRILPYGTGEFEGRAPLTFSAQHDLKANFNCRKYTEVGPGVFRLRPPNDAEVAKMGKVYGTDPHREPSRYFFPPKCGSVNVFGRTRDFYAVYDAAERPIGHGRCSVLIKSEPPACTFWFWLPLERELQFHLSGEHVPQLRSIYAQISELLLNATDLAKSSNLNNRGYAETRGLTSSP